MKHMLAFACPLWAAAHVHSQGTMNIHRTNGTTTFVDMAVIDSVVYQLVPAPPVMRVHQAGGTVLSVSVALIDSITYSPGGPIGTAQIATFPPIVVGSPADQCRGRVGGQGSDWVDVRGICYGTEPLPDLGDMVAAAPGNGDGTFQAHVGGLFPNTVYYARAYATNSSGTSYGNQVSFSILQGAHLNPSITYGSMTDQDGNTYPTVVIGGQEWMAENLRTATYANGDPIPNVTDPGQWSGLTSGAWGHFLHDGAYDMPFGKLYNNFAVMDPRNVCPAGWHVSTEAEWMALADSLGGSDAAGVKLKSTGNISEGSGQWLAPNAGATNESGFSALPGGSYSWDGGFYNGGQNGQWWSPGVGSPTGYRQLSADFGFLTWSPGASPAIGYSVRCVRD